MTGVYFNTAAVIAPTAANLGKYRKHHIPIAIRVSGKSLLHAGKRRLPGLPNSLCPRRRLHLCYDRHFPEGARILGLNGAEIVYNPSATVAGSPNIFGTRATSHAVANAYFVAAINRVGTSILEDREFYARAICDRAENRLAGQPRQDELLVAN